MNNSKELILITRVQTISQRVRVSKLVHLFDEMAAENPDQWKFSLVKLNNPAAQGEQMKHVAITGIGKIYPRKSVEYVRWMIALLGFLFKNLSRRKQQVYYALGFESALTVYLFTRIFRCEFIYDNADSFYLSHKHNATLKSILRSLEFAIARSSNLHILPDEYRADGFPYKQNIELIKNFPSQRAYLKAKELAADYTREEGIKYIYINGWLPPTRGLAMIREALSGLPAGIGLKVLVAGKYDENLKDILELPFVEYLGHLSNEKSLSYYFISDFVLTFYDPSIEINKLASPNKWGDAILTNTVPILNSEILTKDYYFASKGYLEVPYGDGTQLRAIFTDIAENKTNLPALKEKLAGNPVYFWDTEFKKVLNNHILKTTARNSSIAQAQAEG
jgi:hypothetical protein